MSWERLLPMMIKKGNRKRKKINFSIKKGMQVRLILRIFIIILIAVMLSGVIFWLGSQRKVASTYHQFHVQLRNFRDLILPLTIVGVIAGLLGAFVLSLFFPQRLAGPLYRIEMTMDRIINRDLSDPNLRIRSGDELHDLAKQITKLMGKMRENTLFLKEINRRLDVICGQIKDAAGRSDTEMIAEAMPGLEEELIKMREMLNEFKV
jgi:signal transduction histidine kinase